jgi:hypothetical protein
MFVIRCTHCGWHEKTTGFARDLTHLKEVKVGCDKCGKPRRFLCPICKHQAKMTRIT